MQVTPELSQARDGDRSLVGIPIGEVVEVRQHNPSGKLQWQGHSVAEVYLGQRRQPALIQETP
jgi:hypothetical protein